MSLRKMIVVYVQTLLSMLFVHACVCIGQDLDNVNRPASSFLATNVKSPDLIGFRMVRSQPHDVASIAAKTATNGRGERSTAPAYKVNVTNTINSLRSYVGASNMNYLTYSSSTETDAANWTSYCDFDAMVYTSTLAVVVRQYRSSPMNLITSLEADFDNPIFFNALRSVELRSAGAAYSFCSTARINGTNQANIDLAAYVFSITSDFNNNVKQFTIGEPCTTCKSGSYWCYQGLCKSDCSPSDSNCYCNSYCMNCANTNSSTCTCQCLEGWTGPSCEEQAINATAPSCSTTARVPYTWITTTVARTTVARTTVNSTAVDSTTRSSASTITSSLTSVFSMGKSTIQHLLYATTILFLRLFLDQGLQI